MKTWAAGEKAYAADLNSNFCDTPFVSDGADGAVVFNGSSTILGLVPSANTYTLTRDIYCTTVLINASVILKTNGYRVFFTTLTNNGTIRHNGGDGQVGQYSAQASGGIGAPSGTLAGGLSGALGASCANTGPAGANIAASITQVGGVPGGNGGGGIGGLGGTATAENISIDNLFAGLPISLNTTTLVSTKVIKIIAGITSGKFLSGSAASGGGGGGTYFNSRPGGGGAGGNGGIIYLQGITLINNGVIESKGGKGGDGIPGDYPQMGSGGGGGGQGGLVIFFVRSFTGNLPVVTGGAYGAGVGTSSTNGTVGNAGKYLILNFQ